MVNLSCRTADHCSLSQFYLDDIDDDVSMTALRLLVKDLLVLFSAVNGGVINVLGQD